MTLLTNDGIRQAAGEIIGIFDADHVLNPDLVRQAVAELQDPALFAQREGERAKRRH